MYVLKINDHMEFTIHYGVFTENPSCQTRLTPLDHKAIKLLEEYFPEAIRKKTIHSYFTCIGKQGKKNQKSGRFQQSWLFEKPWSFLKKQGCGGSVL